MTAPLQCIDNLVFNWSKCMITEDDKAARVREAGHLIAKAVPDPDNATYLGEPGICPHCHPSVMRLNEDAAKAECGVCSVIGELKKSMVRIAQFATVSIIRLIR